MSTMQVEMDIRDVRDLGVAIPKAVQDAEAVLQAVRERNADRSHSATVAKLKTVAPKDLPKVLDEISEAYARKTAFQAAAQAEATKVAEDRFTRAWKDARRSVLDAVQAKFSGTVEEINTLAAKVPMAVALDLNATNNAEVLANAARLRVLLGGLKKAVNMTGQYVVAQTPGAQTWGDSKARNLVRLTDVPTDFRDLYAVEKTLVSDGEQLSVLDPAGVVALLKAGHKLVFHPVAEQASRLSAVWESRQTYELIGNGNVARIDPADLRRKAALQAMADNMSGPLG